MKRAENLTIIKALADASRLRILDALFKKKQCVEELAKHLELSSPTISFHCKKLEQAGLVSKKKDHYYVVFQTNKDAFTVTLKELVFSDHGRLTNEDEIMQNHPQKEAGVFLSNTQSGRPNGQQDKINKIVSDGCDDYCAIRF
jgi:DNA-binding transcriptional ArsR family regulator